MSELKYEKDLYYKDLSQYFAFAASDLFKSRVYLMMNGEEFVHAFIEVLPGFYLDAKGVFCDINERNTFKVTDVIALSLKEAQEYLKKLKVKYTDVAHKKCVREYLRNNMLTFDYFQNGYTYTMGICAITNMAGNPCVLTYSYDIHKKQWGSYIHTIPLQIFVNNIQNIHGFVLSKGWYYKK